jgi:hypothetical protein
MKKLALALAVVGVVSCGCYMAVTPDGNLALVAQPSLAYIPGTSIQVVNGMDDVMYYGGYYWRFQNGMWMRSNYWNSGWAAHHDVPSVFLGIPSHHPSYHYVKRHPHYRAPSPAPKIAVPAHQPQQKVIVPAHQPPKHVAPGNPHKSGGPAKKPQKKPAKPDDEKKSKK